MMVRRRRRQPGDDGEGEEADPEGLPLHDRQLEEEQLALEDGEDGGEEETLEGPKGPPTTLTPMTPLFTPEQLKGLHEVQSQAPSPICSSPEAEHLAAWYGEQVSGRGEKGKTAVPAEGGGSGWSTTADEYNDGDTITGTDGGSCTDVADQENHGYLKYMNQEAKVMVKNQSRSENR